LHFAVEIQVRVNVSENCYNPVYVLAVGLMEIEKYIRYAPLPWG